jgi:hypothetical protein
VELARIHIPQLSVAEVEMCVCRGPEGGYRWRLEQAGGFAGAFKGTVGAVCWLAARAFQCGH